MKNKELYYHSDHLGSASLISDRDGNEYQRIEYTPYGETWVEKTQNNGLEWLPYKFTAKEMDEETGLYYYGARYLDPKYSRWLSTDPVLGEYVPGAGKGTEKDAGNLPGMGGLFNTVNGNLYHYAGNNPVKYTDPDGRKTFLIVSTFQGGGNQNQGDNFRNAAKTRSNDIKNSSDFNSKTDIVIVKDVKSIEELAALLENGNIDIMEMFGHGMADSLCVGEGEGTDKREYLNFESLSKLNPKAFNKDGKIILHQCNTANEKQLGFFGKLFGKKTIANQMADYFGVSVTGNTAGSTAVPSMDAEIDYSYVPKNGDPIYYKTNGETKTYE